jgi:ADP-ribosylglycohydrolase
VLAIAAAAATAAAISAAIDGAPPVEIIELAQRAAANPTFAQAVRTIYANLRERSELHPGDVATTYFPNGPLTIVPLAIALGTVMDSAEAAILLATNTGGDSDSVASIAGAIAGARRPETINDEWYATVEMVNGHDLTSLAEALWKLRTIARPTASSPR